MAKNRGQEFGVTTNKQTAIPGWTAGLYTLMNDGAGSVFYREQDTGSAFAGNKAAILVLGGSQLKIGESVVVKGHAWDVVCGSDTGGSTATLRIMPGAKSASVNATITGVTVNSDIDSIAGTAINTSSGAVDAGTIVVNQASNGVLATILGTTADAVASGDVVGTLSAKLRGINKALGTIDVDTGNIAGGTGAAADAVVDAGATGSISAKIRRLTTDLDAIKTLLGVGTGAMASAQAVTLATDDTQFGAVGAAADVDGNIHGQLRSIAEATTGAVLTEKVPTWIEVVIGTPGTPTVFAAEGTFATWVGVEAKLAASDNAGIVYVGPSTGTLAVDKDTHQGHALSPGDPWEYEAAPGTKFDLNDLAIDGATTTDGIIFVYRPA